MIPEAAVEAAAKAYYEVDGAYWEDTTSAFRAEECAAIRAALEAAAPHMLAEAWRGGYVSGLHNMEFNGVPTPNPYRPTP